LPVTSSDSAVLPADLQNFLFWSLGIRLGLARGRRRLFQPIGFSLQFRRGPQSRLPDDGITGSFCKSPIPGGELAQATRLFWPLVAHADRCHRALASATDLFKLTERARTRSAQLMIPTMRPSVTTGTRFMRRVVKISAISRRSVSSLTVITGADMTAGALWF
jgi:hypothetical protein